VNRTFFCAVAAALAVPALALAFPNTEPLASHQWYLEQDRAWSFWPTQPALKLVKVAVIDSGIDYGHPEFAGRIIAGRSFVAGSSWQRDTDGHGTFVAGLIAADPGNGKGIAGIAFNAQLLIAKVVQPDGNVYLPGEVAAIKWAVGAGAQVINLSLGGGRDPQDLRNDYFSPAERNAIEYAVSKGVVVVAAAGNGTESPTIPWPYADYPAALPHVIGVGALRQNGSVPDYSNRDRVFVDIAAPGDAMFSTIPRNLVDATTQPECAGQPYSNCGPPEFRIAIGTSFAAPQVAAAAALLLGVDPKLTADQVVWLLERSARDVNAATGCSKCPAGRDSLTGWGRLDVQAALTWLKTGVKLPQPDRYEPNDNAGKLAHPFGPPRTISASLDYWDDPIDVYSIDLQKGRHVYVRLSPSARRSIGLVLWNPGTPTVEGQAAVLPDRAATAVPVGGQQRIAFLVPKTGTYYLEVEFVPPAQGRVSYTLAVATRSS
jgi:subtilisin family serine protease